MSAESQPILSGTDATPLPAKEETPGRQFEPVSVTRFEIDHLRNFVVLLDHRNEKDSAEALQNWIEDKTSRPAIYDQVRHQPARSPSASEIAEAIDQFEVAVIEELSTAMKSAEAVQELIARRVAARSRLEQFFREQQQEIDRLRHPLRALSTKGTEE